MQDKHETIDSSIEANPLVATSSLTLSVELPPGDGAESSPNTDSNTDKKRIEAQIIDTHSSCLFFPSNKKPTESHIKPPYSPFNKK